MDGGEHLVIGAATAGLALWGLRALGAGIEPAAVLAGAVVAGVGALAPDIDHPRSTMSKGLRREILDIGVRLLVLPAAFIMLAAMGGDLRAGLTMALRALSPFLVWGAFLVGSAIVLLAISRVASAFGHRGPTHSLALMVVSTGFVTALCLVAHIGWWYGLIFGVGYMTHLLADATTENGLPSLLWPCVGTSRRLSRRGPAQPALPDRQPPR